MRILITGAPGAGKTRLSAFLAKLLKIEVKSTDALEDMEWSDRSATVAKWMDEPGPWIIEGVTIPRGLRKWKNYNGEDKPPPFDWFIMLPNPRGAYEKVGQGTMAKQVVGLATTMKDWIGERWIEL